MAVKAYGAPHTQPTGGRRQRRAWLWGRGPTGERCDVEPFSVTGAASFSVWNAFVAVLVRRRSTQTVGAEDVRPTGGRGLSARELADSNSLVPSMSLERLVHEI